MSWPSASQTYAPSVAKWVASVEARWEIEGLQDYVAALARADLSRDEPVYLSAAFGVSFTSAHGST